LLIESAMGKCGDGMRTVAHGRVVWLGVASRAQRGKIDCWGGAGCIWPWISVGRCGGLGTLDGGGGDNVCAGPGERRAGARGG